MSERRLRLGIAGLVRAFTLMLPSFLADQRVRLAAAADPRPEARAQFAADFAAPAYATVAELCDAAGLDAIYIATPHQFHAEQACLAAAAGKHVLVEKPMALTLADCARMIEAARAARVRLIVGPSHSFDEPIRHTNALIRSGAVGAVRMITALNFTDFLYRPRRPEELDTKTGGGVFFNQAPHQVDIVRLLGGGRVTSVRSVAGAWDRTRPTEGAYSALLTFASGTTASLTYSGYAHFDSDEWCDGIGEDGAPKDPASYGAARRRLAGATGSEAERAERERRGYGSGAGATQRRNAFHEHFGAIIVSCEQADLRPTPTGVWIYGDDEKRFETLPPPTVPRAAVIDELCAAILEDRTPLHDGAWGLATMEVCLAMLQSAHEAREIAFVHQG